MSATSSTDLPIFDHCPTWCMHGEDPQPNGGDHPDRAHVVRPRKLTATVMDGTERIYVTGQSINAQGLPRTRETFTAMDERWVEIATAGQDDPLLVIRTGDARSLAAALVAAADAVEVG